MLHVFHVNVQCQRLRAEERLRGTQAAKEGQRSVRRRRKTPRGGCILRAQRELKYGPSRSVRRHPEPAVVRLDDRTANRQTHPHSVCFGGEARAEYPSDVWRFDSRPRVCNRYEHEVAFVRVRSHA